MATRIVIALGALLLAAPAAAQAGTSVPEPSDMLLLGMGVLGLILGRSSGRSRKPPRQ
jgi:hypothetical protein